MAEGDLHRCGVCGQSYRSREAFVHADPANYPCRRCGVIGKTVRDVDHAAVEARLREARGTSPEDSRAVGRSMVAAGLFLFVVSLGAVLAALLLGDEPVQNLVKTARWGVLLGLAVAAAGFSRIRRAGKRE